VPDSPSRRIRVRNLRDADDDADYCAMTRSERLACMWQLTLDAWAFVDGFDPQSRLRDILSAFSSPDMSSSRTD
jgi:hypothetical protein